MNSNSDVNLMVNDWIRQGKTKGEIICLTAEAELGWCYVWGAAGAVCNPKNRQAYADRSSCPEAESKVTIKKCQVLNGSKSGCAGCKWFPNGATTLMDDCQGFEKQIHRRVGIVLKGGGATSMYRDDSNWIKKGPISEMPMDQICCVFQYNKDKNNMQHVGQHVGGGNIIHDSGEVKRGKTTDKGWTHYAIPPGLEEKMPTPTHKTIKKGSTGPDVVECQQDLIYLGYDLSPYGADGKFGAKTEAAVKAFQGSVGLKQDGIVGPKTWEALDEAVGPSPAPTKLYTVSIPHQNEEQVKNLKILYPDSWATEE